MRNHVQFKKLFIFFPLDKSTAEVDLGHAQLAKPSTVPNGQNSALCPMDKTQHCAPWTNVSTVSHEQNPALCPMDKSQACDPCTNLRAVPNGKPSTMPHGQKPALCPIENTQY